MREIVGIFAVLPLLTWLLTYKKHRDIAEPYNLFTFLYFINIMIPMILYINVETSEKISELYIRNAVLNDSTFIIYAILQTTSYYLVIFGMKLRITNLKNNIQNKKNVSIMYDSKKYKCIGIIMWIIGAISFLLIMKKVGGIYYFFTHLQYRVSLTRNLDVLSWILPFINYGVLAIAYSYRGTNKSINFKIIALAIISGIMSGLGGRKALIILLIEVLLIYHYCVKEISIKKFLKFKYILGIIVIYLFFIVMPKFRVEGAFEIFAQNPIEFIKQSNNGILSTIRSESYVTYYITIIEYFKTHSFWFGKTFLGLKTAIIPSSIFPDKPPVDDGTYLYSISQGRTDIIPPMPFNKLDGSSLPLETFGSMYGNFGIVGLFLGMIILGVIYKYTYKRMKEKSYNFFDVIIYIQVIFTFQLSTLRIFQIFEMIVVLWIISFIMDKFILKKDKTR